MDSKTLVENRNDYTDHLLDIIVPEISTYFIRIGNQMDTLKNVQKHLTLISKWSKETIENEMIELTNMFEQDDDYLHKLIKELIIIGTKLKILEYEPGKTITKGFKVYVPEWHDFLYKCCITCAGTFWKNPILFYKNVQSIERQNNLNAIEKIVKQSIRTSIRHYIPIKKIMQEYVKKDSFVVIGNNDNIIDSFDDNHIKEKSSSILNEASYFREEETEEIKQADETDETEKADEEEEKEEEEEEEEEAEEADEANEVDEEEEEAEEEADEADEEEEEAEEEADEADEEEEEAEEVDEEEEEEEGAAEAACCREEEEEEEEEEAEEADEEEEEAEEEEAEEEAEEAEMEEEREQVEEEKEKVKVEKEEGIAMDAYYRDVQDIKKEYSIETIYIDEIENDEKDEKDGEAENVKKIIIKNAFF